MGFQSESSYNFYRPGRLISDTTYYWRADAKNITGTTTGDTWVFTTVRRQGEVTPTPTPTPTPAPRAILFIDGAVAESGDGSSWMNAKKTIAEGLAAALPADHIWVAKGTYAEGNLVLTVGGAQLYGGFAGIEDPATFFLHQRDLTANETIVNAIGKGHGIIIAQPASVAQVDYVVDGITVTNGNAVLYSDAVPGVDGVPESQGSPSTYATRGGGFMAYSQPVIGDTRGGTVPPGALVPRIAIRDCKVINCAGTIGGGADFDRALYTIENCVVNGCSSQLGGGGFTFTPMDQGAATVKNTMFAYNSCEGAWGGGGGAWVFGSSVSFDSCKFVGNSTSASSTGGGLGISYQNYVCSNVVAVTNCLFNSNMAPTGGALSCSDYVGGPLNVMNCTFVNNMSNGPAPMGAAIMALAGSPLSVVNSIVSGNMGGYAISSVDPATASYCLFYANSGGDIGPAVASSNALLGNPMFVSAFDYHLQSTSPAIDAGASAGAPTLDMDGYSRLNGPDLGAYEFSDSGVAITPPVPICPNPANGAQDISIYTMLSWNNGIFALADKDAAKGLSAAKLTALNGKIDPFTGKPFVFSARANLVPKKAGTGGGRILWDVTHGVLGDLQPGQLYSSLVSLLASKGFSLELTGIGVNNVNLASYDVLVINLGSAFYSQYSTAEVNAIRSFVNAGGGLFVLGDAPGAPNINIAPVTQAFGVNCGLSDLNSPYNFTNFASHPLFEGCTQHLLWVGRGSISCFSGGTSCLDARQPRRCCGGVAKWTCCDCGRCEFLR